MDQDPSLDPPRRSSRSLSVPWPVFAGVVLAGFIALGPYLDHREATQGPSVEVTGVVPVRVGGEVVFVVSGHAERSHESSSGSSRRTTTTEFPRLQTRRARDGELVATRAYAPTLRFSYVDTHVTALLAEGGRVWAASSDEAQVLRAVHPTTLEDVVPTASLLARVPAFAPGIHVPPIHDDPVAGVRAGQIVVRLDDGAFVALDPSTLATAEIPTDEDEVAEVSDPEPRGSSAVEALVAARPRALEPRVVPVFGVDGSPDATVAYALTDTSLDRDAARVVVERFDLRGPAPVAGFRVELPEVRPTCCTQRAFRFDGMVALWLEHWLVLLDDSTGAVRWTKRL